MNTEPSISTDLWAKILSSGGFFRWQSQWWIYHSLSAEQRYKKDDQYYILKPNFFNLNSGIFKAKARLGPLSSQALKRDLEIFLTHKTTEPLPLEWKPPSSHEFNSCFQAIQKNISAGMIKKAVPVVFLEGKGSITAVAKAQFILRLLQAPESLIPYGVWQEHEGFIGATPEVLFHRANERFETMALAGTQAQDFSGSQDFLDDRKERKEHQFVIDDLLIQLKDLVQLFPEKTRILELPHLRHLLTPMTGVMTENYKNDFQLLEKIHPTAALGVFPRSAGLSWLEHLPGQRHRKTFGAPVAFQLPDDQMIALVGLRRLEWENEDIRIGAGCGLVSESVFEREWSEILRKIESVRKLLGI